MATTITTTRTFSSSEFTHSKPSFNPETSIKGLKYAWGSVKIGPFETHYGYITGLTITFNGTALYAGVSFQSPPPIRSPFSVGKDGINGLFVPFDGTPLQLYDLRLTNGVPINPYIIVNGDQNNVTDKLEILLSVGVKYNVNPGDLNSITISFVCEVDTPVPLYSAYTGLHVYSPYDSINTPKLHTYLYSKVNPLLWDVGTRVWCSPWFDKVSPQYYYGYDINNKVYKVGGPLDRGFGTKKIYDVRTSIWRNWWHKKPRIRIKIEGPQSYYHSGDDTVDACVEVLLSRAGIISEVISKASIPPPSKYKYWMGYNAINKQLSNDDFFAKWSFGQEMFYPITGFQHMLYKLSAGYYRSIFLDTGIAGSFGDLESMIDKYAILAAAGFSIAFTFVWWLLNLKLEIAFMPELFYGTNTGWLFANIGTSTLTPIGLLPMAILLLSLLWSIFSQKRKIVREVCKIFLGEYLEKNGTNGPYIELNGILSRLQNMTDKKIGYYCDGVYFYYQPTTTGITVKELSSTNALVNEDPIKQQFMYSVPCDDPTTVVAIEKLLLLPYTSGMPVEYPGGTIWYSAAILRTVTLTDCAELLVTPPTQEYTLPAGYCFSFISQIDADTKAAAVALNIDHMVAGAFNYGEPLSEANLGVLDSYFTHEIRVEITPTTCTIFYNNTDQQGPIVGRKVYFDMEGRYETLNGYYATDSDTYFRIFYKVVDSVITNKYIMLASNSTTVQGLGGVEDTLPVITANLTYSSNWYIQSPAVTTITDIVNQMPRCFDPNTLYVESYTVRGYYDAANNHFLLYGDNYNNYTTSQAPPDYYLPLIEWIDERIFEFSPIISIAINIEEICLPATEYEHALYGFYVIGSASGNVTPLFNEVDLTVYVYVDNIFKASYHVVTNESGRTYVSYNGLIAVDDNVTSIVIHSINSPNPIGNITYTIGTFVGCLNCPPNNLFETGLQACWNFEDASAPILDSTSNNNDLSQINSVNFHQIGKVGPYCIQLPLATSFASTMTSDTLALTTLSISTWVKCAGTTFYGRTIFSKVSKQSGVDHGGYFLMINPSIYGGVRLHLCDSYGTNIHGTQETGRVTDGNWHHIVATIDTNSVDKILKIYRDGVLEVNENMEQWYGSQPIPYGNTYVPATIGNLEHLGYHYPLIGFVDATAIWDRVLTSQEVEILYSGGNGRVCSSGSLEACWNFEEASGTVYDSTANNHDLTINNLVSYHQPGKIGTYAVSFNSSTSYLRGDTGLNLTPTMSISVWVKLTPGTTTYNRFIYNKSGFSPNRGVNLYVQANNGKPVFETQNGNAGGSAQADVSVNDGNWHHIVATMDTNIMKVCMYVDGVGDLSNPHSMTITPDYGNNSTPITIGQSNILTNFSLYGSIDGLAVWNKVLTPCEVQSLYNNGNGVACV